MMLIYYTIMCLPFMLSLGVCLVHYMVGGLMGVSSIHQDSKATFWGCDSCTSELLLFLSAAT
jgi:hypothetical protein